jgi:uncharacterized protein YbjT (DUF2867 family)
LLTAFRGVDKLILVSTDGPGVVRIAQHQNAIDAARAAGVKHIFYTSFIDVAADSPAEYAAVHRASEAALAASGIAFTALRNPLYADFLPMTVAAAWSTGTFQLPAGGGRASFISRAELSEAIAAAALAPALARTVYELTGQANTRLSGGRCRRRQGHRQPRAISADQRGRVRTVAGEPRLADLVCARAGQHVLGGGCRKVRPRAQ